MTSKSGQKPNHPFPALLLVVPDEVLKKFLHRYINQLLEEEAQAEIDFYISTVETIKNNNAKNIWERVE